MCDTPGEDDGIYIPFQQFWQGWHEVQCVTSREGDCQDQGWQGGARARRRLVEALPVEPGVDVHHPGVLRARDCRTWRGACEACLKDLRESMSSATSLCWIRLSPTVDCWCAFQLDLFGQVAQHA